MHAGEKELIVSALFVLFMLFIAEEPFKVTHPDSVHVPLIIFAHRILNPRDMYPYHKSNVITLNLHEIMTAKLNGL